MIYIKYLVIISAALILFNCAGVQLNIKLSSKPDDWLMSGRTPLQQNNTEAVLAPPLELVWRYKADAGIGQSALSFSDGTLFANTLNGEMHVLNAADGSKIGHLESLGKEAATTPLIVNNITVLSFAGHKENSLVAYNLLTSANYWQMMLGDFQASPILYNDNIYIGSLNGNFYKVNFKSGRMLWEYQSKAPIRANCAAAENKIIFPNDNGLLTCIDTANGEPIWKFSMNAQSITSPMINNDYVYTGAYDSNYYCISLDSGKTKWQRNMRTKISSGSALYKDAVIFPGIDGRIYSLNSESGDVLWTFLTKGVILSSPAVSGNYLYFTSQDMHLYCIDAGTGLFLWKYLLESRSRTSPVITGNFLIAASDLYIYCFKKKI